MAAQFDRMEQLNYEGRLIAPAALSWLQTTVEARMLSVFNHSCTLTREDGELLSIVTREIGPGPFTLVIEPGREHSATSLHPFSGVRIDRSVNLRNGVIVVDRLKINTGLAELWNPRPNWANLNANSFIKSSSVLKNFLEIHGPSGSLAALITGKNLNRTQQKIAEVWSILAEPLSRLDLSNSHHLVGQIAGLGGGLTPAGDDFLMGVLMALWCVIPEREAQSVAHDIARATIGRTTMLSTAWLEAAHRGEVAQYWHHFFVALENVNRVDINNRCLRIISVGHTSGADALAGFILAGDVLSKSSSAKG